MKDLIEFIARSLVDQPDQVSVNEVQEDRALVVELTVAQEDLGKLIGKQGRTVRAIRAVLNAAATRAGQRTVLEILE